MPRGSKVGKTTFDGGSSEWLYEAAYSLLPISLLIIIHLSLLHSFSFGVLTIGSDLQPPTNSWPLFHCQHFADLSFSPNIILRNSSNHIINIQVHCFHPLLSTPNSATHLKSQTSTPLEIVPLQKSKLKISLSDDAPQPSSISLIILHLTNFCSLSALWSSFSPLILNNLVLPPPQFWL